MKLISYPMNLPIHPLNYRKLPLFLEFPNLRLCLSCCHHVLELCSHPQPSSLAHLWPKEQFLSRLLKSMPLLFQKLFCPMWMCQLQYVFQLLPLFSCFSFAWALSILYKLQSVTYWHASEIYDCSCNLWCIFAQWLGLLGCHSSVRMRIQMHACILCMFYEAKDDLDHLKIPEDAFTQNEEYHLLEGRTFSYIEERRRKRSHTQWFGNISTTCKE